MQKSSLSNMLFMLLMKLLEMEGYVKRSRCNYAVGIRTTFEGEEFH